MLPEPGVLYREHAAAVWRYARSRLPTDADAEDVTSDVFTRAMRSTRAFDPSLGTPRSWVMGIARHATADWWRGRAPEAPVAEPHEVPHHDGPERAVLAAADAGEVRRLLDHLSTREREVVALRFGAELSSADIGEALGISPTAARMLLHRAITKLRGVVEHG